MEVKKGEIFVYSYCNNNDSAIIALLGKALIDFDVDILEKEWRELFPTRADLVRSDHQSFQDWLVSKKIIEPLPFKDWSH